LSHGCSFGVCLKQGRRATMEDFAAARWATCRRSGQELGLFCVADGHGGARAADFVSRTLLDAIAAHESFPEDLPSALVASFEAVDAQYLEEGARHAAEVAAQKAAAAAAAADEGAAAGTAAANAAACTASPRVGNGGSTTPPPPPPQRGSGYYYYGSAGGARSPGASNRPSPGGANGGGYVGSSLTNGLVTAAAAPPGEDGSTAVVAVLLADGTLAIANVGDSRAVLMRAGRAHTLSVDHKPNLREERIRVEKAGGAVVWSGVWRVGCGGAGGVLGGGNGGAGGGGLLALSRAFGDRPLKLGAGVIATPDVRVTRLGKEDEVLVLASDGVWDTMNAQEALLIARREGLCASAAARAVADEAIARGSMDNVGVVVVHLKGAFGGGGGKEEKEGAVAAVAAAAAR
jgi:serine/threonine protein phosphatase PrpC